MSKLFPHIISQKAHDKSTNATKCERTITNKQQTVVSESRLSTKLALSTCRKENKSLPLQQVKYSFNNNILRIKEHEEIKIQTILSDGSSHGSAYDFRFMQQQ